MPAQQGLGGDQEAGPADPGQHAADRGQQGAVSGLQPGSRGLAAQDRELVAQDQDLQVLAASPRASSASSWMVLYSAR
jgi:hypothetical protein